MFWQIIGFITSLPGLISKLIDLYKSWIEARKVIKQRERENEIDKIVEDNNKIEPLPPGVVYDPAKPVEEQPDEVKRLIEEKRRISCELEKHFDPDSNCKL